MLQGELLAEQAGQVRETLPVLFRRRRLAEPLTQHELAVHQVECCLRVGGQVGELFQVGLGRDGVAQSPALVLVQVEHRRHFAGRQRAGPLGEEGADVGRPALVP